MNLTNLNPISFLITDLDTVLVNVPIRLHPSASTTACLVLLRLRKSSCLNLAAFTVGADHLVVGAVFLSVALGVDHSYVDGTKVGERVPVLDSVEHRPQRGLDYPVESRLVRIRRLAVVRW